MLFRSTPDFVEDGIDGILYRCEEWEILAEKICEIFASPELAICMGHKSIDKAKLRHDAESNAIKLLEIYKTIVDNE